MQESTQRYKALTNLELFQIVDQAEDYKPHAVEAAKKEIENRQLSEEERVHFQSIISADNEKKALKSAAAKKWENKLRKSGSKFFDTISPITKGIQSTEKRIRLISLLFCGILMLYLYSEIGIIQYLFLAQAETETADFWFYLLQKYIFPLLVVPLGTFLFWRRKRMGWILLHVFLSYTLINLGHGFYLSIVSERFLFPALSRIFPEIASFTYLVTIIFWGGILWILSKADVREVYGISKKTLFLSIGVGLACYVLLSFLNTL